MTQPTAREIADLLNAYLKSQNPTHKLLADGVEVKLPDGTTLKVPIAPTRTTRLGSFR